MITVRRNSSMELLRIILMIFIIIHHIIYQVVTPNFDNRMYACVDVFLHTAVIIFVLITGYFGLRFSWHKAMLLLFQVLFYSILLGSIAHLYFGIGTTFDFFKCFFPISSNAYWFYGLFSIVLSRSLYYKIVQSINRSTIFSFIDFVFCSCMLVWFLVERECNYGWEKCYQFYLYLYVGKWSKAT